MLVLAVAVNHSPAREVTSNPQESWLKNRGWPGLRIFRKFRLGHSRDDLVIRILKFIAE